MKQELHQLRRRGSNMKKLITICRVFVIIVVVSSLALAEYFNYNAHNIVGDGTGTITGFTNITGSTVNPMVSDNVSITGGSITGTPISGSTGSFSSITRGTVSDTEFSYLDNVSSGIQTQLDLKSPLASPTFTGTVTIPTPFALGAVSITATGTELNYSVGVTSALQGQINAKQASSAMLTNLSSKTIQDNVTIYDDKYIKFGTDNDFTLRYKSADATLVIALDNGDMMCTFSKTGNLTCTGEATFSQYNSASTDNTYGINVMDTADPTGANLEAGLLWGPTDNVMRVRNADNTVTNNLGLLVAVPSAANSSCTPGMFADNTTHHMSCIATDTWMRASHATW